MARKDLGCRQRDRLVRRKSRQFDGDRHIHQRIGLVDEDHGWPRGEGDTWNAHPANSRGKAANSRGKADRERPTIRSTSPVHIVAHCDLTAMTVSSTLTRGEQPRKSSLRLKGTWKLGCARPLTLNPISTWNCALPRSGAPWQDKNNRAEPPNRKQASHPRIPAHRASLPSCPHPSIDRLDCPGKESGGLPPSGELRRCRAAFMAKPPSFGTIADQAAQRLR